MYRHNRRAVLCCKFEKPSNNNDRF